VHFPAAPHLLRNHGGVDDYWRCRVFIHTQVNGLVPDVRGLFEKEIRTAVIVKRPPASFFGQDRYRKLEPVHRCNPFCQIPLRRIDVMGGAADDVDARHRAVLESRRHKERF